MAKTVAPLLSFGASGKLADTLVYANWRGRDYVRRYVKPANPKSTEQMKTRNTFSGLEKRWKQGGSIMRQPWDAFAAGLPLVGRNAYIGKNISVIRDDAGMDEYIGSPGAKGGLPPLTLALTTVAGNGIEAVVTVPADYGTWTITAVQATFLKDQAADAVVTDIVVEGEDVATPFSVDVVGLDTVAYWVQAWTKWTSTDGRTSYGPSIADTIVVT